MASTSGSGTPGRAADDSGESGEPSRVKPQRTLGETSLGGLSSVSFLTVAEVASLMRVSKMTVYRLLHSGELAGARVGRAQLPAGCVHRHGVTVLLVAS